MTICMYLFGSHFTSGLALPWTLCLPTIKDPGLKVEKVLNGLDHPTQMAFLGPEDFLVLEKNNGKVLRVLNASVMSKPLVDVNVANKNERGLLGLAVAKNLNTALGRDGGQDNYAIKIFLFYTESDRDGNDNCPKVSNCERRNTKGKSSL